MRRLLVPLALTALCLGASAPKVLTAERNACVEESSLGKRFSFSGSCSIRCSNGTCKVYCESGIVFALDEKDAKVQAEIKLRNDASREGIIIEGSLNVTVFNF